MKGSKQLSRICVALAVLAVVGFFAGARHHLATAALFTAAAVILYNQKIYNS